MVKIMLMILGMFWSCILCSAQESDSNPSFLIIVNTTNWPASIRWRSQDKEYNVVINARSSEMLGAVAEISMLEVATYGQLWGSCFPKHTISLDAIKSDDKTDKDVQIIIEKTMWSCSWSFTTCFCAKPRMRIKSLPSDPWNAFPGVKRAQAMGRPIMSHHILNVDPSLMTYQMALNCYKRLCALWNPERFPAAKEGTAKAICSILYQAHMDLQRELIADSRHIEQSIYQPWETLPQ